MIINATLFSLREHCNRMTQSTGGGEKSEATRLDNSTYNILRAAGIDADFLYDTVDTYINDAQKANRNDLVDVWNTIKNDRQRHLRMLREALEKEAKQEKLKGE
jgi:rubrerythrin